MTFTPGQIVRHRATGQKAVVVRVDTEGVAVDYEFGRGTVVVKECVVEADKQDDVTYTPMVD